MIKKWLAFAVVLAIALCGFAGCGGSGDEIVLNVFNWGEYISDGEGSWEYTDENGNVTEIPYLDINKAFEEYYAQKHPGKKVRVNYTTYASNEELYAKLTTSDASYDVIIPSDYLIPLLIDENLIQPIQRENIPNMDNIGEKYIVEGISYREENGEKTYYSATYTFGKVGIIYNLTLLEQTFADFSQEEFEAEGFATAQFAMMKEDGYTGEKSYINASVSDEGGRELYVRALDMLKAQQPIIQKYVMDEVFNKMETGNAAIAPYYVGDYFTMTWNCEDYELCFFYPEEGSNSFLDAMCVPTSSRNPEIAQEYINFMLSVDEDPTKSIAAINAEYICYATPNIAVQQDEHYRYFVENEMHERGYELLYSENSFDFEGEGFARLDDATQQCLNECWDRLKIQDEESSLVLPIVCGVIAVAIIGVVVFVVIRKKKKEKYYQD